MPPLSKRTAVEMDQRACAQDPDVAAGVAQLSMLMTTSTGILTCMTTAWWSSVCDYSRVVRNMKVNAWLSLPLV